MTEVLFYHLERARLEHILPDLLEKSMERGWRVLVATSTRDMADTINNFLWTYTDESFLPHGTDGDGADHPIFITETDSTGGERDVLFLVEGAEAEPETIENLIRCIRIFDGGDEQAVTAARGFWTKVKAAGHAATYWRQNQSGRWEKQG
ncbi:DNA polymerase III subunit chi [Aquisalinus flavus]|nr:DNA polymerase III subunit chi [Aquisalinus flavus]MBD0427908.1 DNA polymerase III subunit chi [Aquisalinus flavus]UNE47667.1 DNA polymerase III subunit chi [Aquisalinus flavus]